MDRALQRSLSPRPTVFVSTDTTDAGKRLFASAACVAFAGGLTVAALNSFQWSEQALDPPGASAKVGALSSSLHTEGDLLCHLRSVLETQGVALLNSTRASSVRVSRLVHR